MLLCCAAGVLLCCAVLWTHKIRVLTCVRFVQAKGHELGARELSVDGARAENLETVTGIANGSLVLTNQKIKFERSLATNGSVGF